ncbi:MAG: branched-chain-amino-acid transaminase [Phycisphaerae bacterium]|nr:branched-chain-amino-acid transaminase [Phycisphaerae bacterium]
MKVWLDGQLVDKADAKLSMFDHGTLYGDGVFEGIRVYGGKIFECQAHMDRLFASASKIRLTIPYTQEQIVAAMAQTLVANGMADGYIRLVVTRGVGTLGLNPNRCPRGSVFVIAGQIELYPREMYERGMPVIIAKTRRTSPAMLDPSVKSLNYLNNIMAKIEATDAGVGEAIMLNDRGEVSEATGDNIFIVKDGAVLTPPVSAGILQGITRRVVMELCAAAAIPCREQTMTPADLFAADECFLTGTAAEVIPVTKIDHRDIAAGTVGPISQRLITAFHEFIRL